MKNMGLNLDLLQIKPKRRSLTGAKEVDYSAQAKKDFEAYDREAEIRKDAEKEKQRDQQTFYCKTYLCNWEGKGLMLWHKRYCPCCGSRVYKRGN